MASKTWGQLFRSTTQQLWFRPPPAAVTQEVNREDKFGPRYGKFNDLAKKVKEPKDGKKGGRHDRRDKHGPKHRGKKWDHRNIDGGKNKRGKR